MEYLNSSQIKIAVEHYIKNAPYAYSIMIDGKWGTGKSYLMKKEIIPLIETIDSPVDGKKYKVVYISLYGIESLQDLSKQIMSSILYSAEFLNSRFAKTGKKLKPIIGIGLRMVSDFFDKSFIPDSEQASAALFDTMESFTRLDRYTFVFDDLERSTISVLNILGFISNLLENNNVKAIIVANESEIKDMIVDKFQHDRYIDFVKIMHKITLPPIVEKPTTRSLLFGNKNKNEKPELEKVKKYVDTLFPPDEIYKRYKEKVVGQTLFYQPDINMIIPTIIDTIFVSDNNVSLLNKEYLKNYFAADLSVVFTNTKHYNLRTIQILIKYLSRIIQFVIESVVNRFGHEDHFTLSKIISGISIIAIQSSEGVKIDDENFRDAIHGRYSEYQNCQYMSFKFAVDYFYYGIYDEEEIKGTINAVVEIIWQDTDNPDSPLNKLSNFYSMNEGDVIKQYERMLDSFSKGQIQPINYPNMLRSLLNLKSLDLISGEIIERIVENMCDNVCGMNTSHYHVDSMIAPQEESERILYQEYLAKIDASSKNIKHSNLQNLIASALDTNKLWTDELSQIYNNTHIRAGDNVSYLLLVNIEKLLNVIKISTSLDLLNFRLQIDSIYGRTIISKTFPKTLENIIHLHKEIDKLLSIDDNVFYDRVARQQVIWLKKDLARFLNLNADQI